MSIENKAEKLAKYAETLDTKLFYATENPVYKRMGEIIIDGILQAGLNWDKVVFPRVERFRKQYPENKTVSDFIQAVCKDGWEEVCGWKHETKLGRIRALVEFLQKQKIETVADFRKWAEQPGNPELLLAVKGVGRKTRDYLQMLAGVPMVAVDVHLQNFMKDAGISISIDSAYERAKEVIIAASKRYGVTPFQFEQAIWLYMAKKNLSAFAGMTGPCKS